jgi:hypothetical protein
MNFFVRATKDIDWTAKWFEVLEANGIDVSMKCVYLPSPDAAPVFYQQSHVVDDGISAMNKLMNILGYESQPEKSIVRKKPNVAQILNGIRNYQKYSALNHVSWKELPKGKDAQPSQIHYLKFNRDETAALQLFAKKSKTSLPALLLWALNESIITLQTNTAAPQVWLFPINMRPFLNTGHNKPNQTSFIAIKINQQENPSDVFKTMLASLKERHHWGSWYGMRLYGKLFGAGIFAKAYQKYQRTKHSWTGTFTYLGAWPTKSVTRTGETRDDLVFGTTVVMGFLPIGASALIWKDQLIIGLRMHETVTTESQIPQDCVARWKDVLLQKLG